MIGESVASSLGEGLLSCKSCISFIVHLLFIYCLFIFLCLFFNSVRLWFLHCFFFGVHSTCPLVCLRRNLSECTRTHFLSLESN